MWKRVQFGVLMTVIAGALVLGAIPQTPCALAGENGDNHRRRDPDQICCLVQDVSYGLGCGGEVQTANAWVCGSLVMVTKLICGTDTLICPGGPDPRD